MENLMAAFAGESQANRRYLSFSRAAQAEGNLGLAMLFKATAESETVHALNHFGIAGGVKTALENLETAIHGETYEFEKMYPEFIETASTEGQDKAMISFMSAAKVEALHARLFRKAYDLMKQGQPIIEVKYFVCSVCGNLEIGEAPDKCPVCHSPKEVFSEVLL